MRSTLSVLAVAALSTAAFAQQPASDPDRAVLRPDGASAPAAAAKRPPRTPGAHAARHHAGSAASGAMGKGMGGEMGRMHERAHKPGGMHDQMHGKDGTAMGAGPMSAMPAASAASQ